jgi:hypothetical protein
LANLHKTEIVSVIGLQAPQGFAAKVRQLNGTRPEAVEILLNPGNPFENRFIGFGSDSDSALWGLAGVTNTVLSGLLDIGKGVSKELIVADWSNVSAPLIISVSNDGEIVRADRPEPLAGDLLLLLKGKKTSALGTCPVCGRFFERLRKDQLCDNRRCRDALRQRKFRGAHRRARTQAP